MKPPNIKEIICKHSDQDIIEGILAIVILLVLAYYSIFSTKKDFSTIIDLTIFFGIVTAFISKFITGLLSSWIHHKIEDQLKLDTNYNKIVKQYPRCPNKISYTNSETANFHLGRKATHVTKDKTLSSQTSHEDCYTFPVTLEYLGNLSSITIEDTVSQYELPERILCNYDQLISAHSNSDIYNQLNIRLDDLIVNNASVTLKTSRTSYFDSLVTNRAMDFKWHNGLCIRDLYSYGPFLPSLKESLLSNHLGFNGFIETSDHKIIFVIRSSNVSIGKDTLGTSVAASLKCKYALNDNKIFTPEGLTQGIINEIKDELCINQEYYTFDLYKNIIGIYRDMVEGGKPQFLLYVKVNQSSSEINQHFHDVGKPKSSRWNLQKTLDKDGSKLVFIDSDQLRNLYITPDTLVVHNKAYKIMPSASASASIIMLINYLTEQEVI